MGIAAYFSLPSEPSLLLFCGFLGVSMGLFAWRPLRIPALLITLFCLGLVVASWRTTSLSTPMLQEDWGPAEIQGVVTDLERGPQGVKVKLCGVAGLAGARDVCVRLRVRGARQLQPLSSLELGQELRVYGKLHPPQEPLIPGGFDFRRKAFFEGLTADGFALGVPEVMPQKTQQVPFWVALRHQLTYRLRDHLGGQEGALAAALITGDRSGLDNTLRQHYADAGLAHLLAISGLHLSILVGLIFFIIRAGLSLIPSIALRHDTKRLAAGVTIPLAWCYLAIAGFPTPALRAFIMACVVLLGIMVGREAITLRNVALAAFVILLFWPETLVLPSFQMSFAAVTALVAGYEWLSPHMARWRAHHPGALSAGALYVGGTILSSVIATLGTAPFVAATFGRVAALSVFSNIIAIPLLSFLIMPLLLLFVILMAVGGEGLILSLLQDTLSWMHTLAKSAANWPGAILLVKHPSTLAYGLVVLGGLGICLGRALIKGSGGLLAAAGLILWIYEPLPQVYIGPKGKLVGWLDAQGRPCVTSLTAERRARQTWLQFLGEEEATKQPLAASSLYNAERASLSMDGSDHVQLGSHRIALDGDSLASGAFYWVDQTGNLISRSVGMSIGHRPWSQMALFREEVR
ncbi:MAG: ComEC/Rec2 family competence protein [Holosporales bacterium]